MTISTTINNVRVNGAEFRTTLAEHIVAGEISLSASSVTAFEITILDQHGLGLTTRAGQVFREGTTLTWEGYAFGVTSFTTGGGTQGPTVRVEATSDFVRGLRDDVGGKNWGKTGVSPWATSLIRSKGASPLVQPNLGEREIERVAAEGAHEVPESSWDVLAEMAKQVGAWLFEYEHKIVLARPSWLVAQPGTRQYRITWNTWTDHTDGLTSAPEYTWIEDRRPWEGRERLIIRAMDPRAGSVNPMSQARPGDLLRFEGAGNPSDDPLWMVHDVEMPLVTGKPVRITCWRPVDPPEIVPDETETTKGSSAGVPNGPLGSFGWQGEQLRMATEIVKEGQRRGLPTLAIELAVACSMGESSLRNIGYGDAAGPDSTGLFQQRNTWGSRSDRMSPGKSAGLFYAALVATPYQDTYRNGGASIVFGGSYGPGNTGNSASLAIHNVQRNSDPLHYARFWSDARLVVRECVRAGESSGGGRATGPLGSRIDHLMSSYDGKLIDVDGFPPNAPYQCVDLAAKYITDLFGIPMVQGNGRDYWRHPVLMGRFAAVPASQNPRKGDVVSWSGSSGAYRNGGYGHVAIYSHTIAGQHYYLSQNPGASRVMPLQSAGILGWMRPSS